MPVKACCCWFHKETLFKNLPLSSDCSLCNPSELTVPGHAGHESRMRDTPDRLPTHKPLFRSHASGASASILSHHWAILSCAEHGTQLCLGNRFKRHLHKQHLAGHQFSASVPPPRECKNFTRSLCNQSLKFFLSVLASPSKQCLSASHISRLPYTDLSRTWWCGRIFL